MTTPTPLYQTLASSIETYKRVRNRALLQENPKESRDYVLASAWLERVERIMDTAPSGSGIDLGTRLDLEESGNTKLVFQVDYHHMNDSGYYDGWTEHRAIVTPRLTGIDIKITGRNRNGIKDLLGDEIHHWLTLGIDIPLDMDPVLKYDIERATK